MLLRPTEAPFWAVTAFSPPPPTLRPTQTEQHPVKHPTPPLRVGYENRHMTNTTQPFSHQQTYRALSFSPLTSPPLSGWPFSLKNCPSLNYSNKTTTKSHPHKPPTPPSVPHTLPGVGDRAHTLGLSCPCGWATPRGVPAPERGRTT